jgi:hypothetical protein
MRGVDRFAVFFAACTCLGLLSACGGSGGNGGTGSVGGSSGGGGGDVSSSYTIGGSIVGLTGLGLVLLDNGGDALDVPANATSFQFSGTFAPDSPYDVTIQSQPSGETCSVGFAIGTTGLASVGPSVSCSAGYTVGGTLTGLTAGGLVLVNNGSAEFAVGAAGSFQFTVPVAIGSNYAVTVQAQPIDETCNVSNGTGTITAGPVNNVIVSCSFTSTAGDNVVPISINPGPASSAYQTYNEPYVSVTVCQPNSTTCITIPNVLLDTGSVGLRLMKSALVNANLTLTPIADPNNNANTLQECLPFVDGYTWGAVAAAGVQMAGLSAADLPIQIIDDSASPSPAAPASCTSNGTSRNSVDALDAEGILGVGLFVQDCGTACVDSSAPNIYYTCTSGGTCTSTALAAGSQVANPVAYFGFEDNGVMVAHDNNGVIVQLGAIPATGAATASGYLVFGVNSESNNNLTSAFTYLTADGGGNFTTSFDNQTLTASFIDSGSNALFFPDSSIAACGDAPVWYCPGSSVALSTDNLTATNQGANGTTSNVSFQIANLDYLRTNDGGNFALDDLGAPTSDFAHLSNAFDWGMPFFYGRTLFFMIEGFTAGSAAGPAYAY